MTMQFSAYQIESMLYEYQQENFPSDRSSSETLSLSEEAINEARHHFSPSVNRSSIWQSPKKVIEMIEDKTDYDELVDFVQQSRAGRFVEPVYVPQNSPPKFSLVTDYSKHGQKDAEENMESRENVNDQKNLYSKLGSSAFLVKDRISVNGTEAEKDISPHLDQMNISISEKGEDLQNQNIAETEIVKEACEESISEKNREDAKNLNKSKKKNPTDSAVKLFENIEGDVVDEEFEVFEKGSHDDAENDVVFGDGQIDSNSLRRFVKSFPDSAIKFLFRKNLDGSKLPFEYEEIYVNWEKRGLSRGRLKTYLFKLMKWENFPDISILEVVQRIKDRQYDMKDKN